MRNITLAIAVLAGASWLGSPSPAASDEDAPAAFGDKFPLADFMANRNQNRTPAASTTPQRVTSGMLAIQAVQGTPGGRAIGAAKIEVELHHRGMLYDVIETQLDDHGVSLIEELPVSMGLQPLVRVYWSDLTYQVTGTVMDANNPYQKLEVVCYEPTEEQPPWKVLMRHVMLQDTRDGLAVTEVMVVENPAEHTWIGARAANQDESAKRTTTVFKLPANAKDVALGRGFHEWCCSTIVGDRLVNHVPLMPGKTEMVFGYVLPARKGKVALDLPMPAAPGGVEHVMLLVPDALQTESFTGLQLGGTDSMGHEAVRFYMAADTAAVQSPQIVLAGLRGGGPAIASSASESFAKIVALIGGGVILLIAVAVVMLKSTSRRLPSARRPVAQAPTFEI